MGEKIHKSFHSVLVSKVTQDYGGHVVDWKWRERWAGFSRDINSVLLDRVFVRKRRRSGLRDDWCTDIVIHVVSASFDLDG